MAVLPVAIGGAVGAVAGRLSLWMCVEGCKVVVGFRSVSAFLFHPRPSPLGVFGDRWATRCPLLESRLAAVFFLACEGRIVE